MLFPAEPGLQALGAVCNEPQVAAGEDEKFLKVEWWQWLQNNVNAPDAQSRYFNVVAIYAWLSKWSTNHALAFVLSKSF